MEKEKTEVSKLAEHANETGHSIQWDKTKIIGQETHTKKRIIHEAIMMKSKGTTISEESIHINNLWLPVIRKYIQPPLQPTTNKILMHKNNTSAARRREQ